MLARIRRADRVARLRDLVLALNFLPRSQRITRDRWTGLGLDAASLAATLHSIGRRAGATATALVFTRTFDAHAAERAARSLQNADPAHHSLLLATDRRFRTLAVISIGPDLAARTCTIDRTHPRASDAETLLDMVAPDHEGTASIAIRYARALDRARVTGRFFEEFRARRTAIAAAWTGLPGRRRSDRDQLALLLLCRLMFLYFLQHAGHLAGNPRFLAELIRRTGPRRGSIYRSAVVPLFFGALNRRPEHRAASARRLGDLPYLNGGLFERHALERRYPRLDLPDAALLEVFEHLLERYRFTTREPADARLDTAFDGGIDPEMLGRVFEGVMDADQRSSTGAFYTPAHAVDRLVREALAAWLAPITGTTNATTGIQGAGPHPCPAAARALEHARILDPACGSGAFLLGALSRTAAIRAAAAPHTSPATIRRDIVARSLHGVDLDADAALLCALRLWLALAETDDDVQPLPNLDRRIRQGDALLDPIDLAIARTGRSRATPADVAVRKAISELQPVAAEYVHADPQRRERLRSAVASHERTIARAWIDALRLRARHHVSELRAAAADRDLFGELPRHARAAAAALPASTDLERELQRLRRRLRDDRATPFFSFHVHFADAVEPDGFDLVLSNPPWIRAHRWPRAVREMTRQRYAARTTGWPLGARLAGAPAAAAAQTDIALLFLERGLSLLAPGGVLAYLLPAKIIRSLYAGGARQRLLSDSPILSIRDCSLDQHAIFRADAFAASIVTRRPAPDAPAPARVRVCLVRKDRNELEFDIDRADLPLLRDEPAAPWLLAPEKPRLAMRHMQKQGAPLGLHDGLRVRRGVFTGANRVLLVDHATPRIGGLATIRTLGFDAARDSQAAAFEAVVESRQLRPVVRGTDIRPWAWKSDQLVIFLHDESGRATPPTPRLGRFLHRHRDMLSRRSGSRHGLPIGALFRVSRDTFAHKVAWQDLASTLEAVALPANARSCLGDHGPVIPLNSSYFIPTTDPDLSLILAAILNSTPIRAFARTIAERAKDARFRFFAWTVAALPLPPDWPQLAQTLLPIARMAHADKGLAEPDALRLDHIVARAYHLDHRQLEHLAEFDHWLGGQP